MYTFCDRRDLYFLELNYLFCSYIRVCFQLIAYVREHIWHKALLIGYPMRIELTRLNDFLLVMVYIEVFLSFYLSVFYLSLLYPSLIFDVFVVVCLRMCVCVGVVLDFTNSYFSCVCVCVCVCVCFGDLCMCVYVVLEYIKP